MEGYEDVYFDIWGGVRDSFGFCSGSWLRVSGKKGPRTGDGELGPGFFRRGHPDQRWRTRKRYRVSTQFRMAILRTSSCTRSKPAEYAYDDLEKLLDHGWSQPVNGLRARISLLPDNHGESPILKIFIEIQNVVNIMGQRIIRFSPSRLELRVVDQAGGEVAAVEPMYNGLSPEWKDTILPHGGTIKFNITYPGSGYLQPNFMAIDLGPSKFWPLALNDTYFVSGKLVIPPQKGDHPFLDWSGALEMPMIVVRAVPPRSVR